MPPHHADAAAYQSKVPVSCGLQFGAVSSVEYSTELRIFQQQQRVK